jgi:hypothetical protein
MPIFLMISRHSPENCPAFNEKARKIWTEYLVKLDGILKKHGMKNLGACNVHTEHLGLMMLEAPSLEAFNKYEMEPEVLALSAVETYEVKSAIGMEEAMKMLKQAK